MESMLGLWKKIILSILIISQWGCAYLSRRDGAVLPDSQLSNLNPAPESMSPPVYGDKDHPRIDSTYMRSQADYHFTMGEAYSLEGKSQKAIEEFKLTLVYDSKSPRVHLKLATEYVRQGLLSEAIEQTERALELDPEGIEARMILGGLYHSLKMYDQAMTQYNKVLELDPEHVKAPVYIGAILAEQKKFDESAEVFLKLAKNPKNDEPEHAYFYMGRIRAEQGEPKAYKQAEKAYEKAISIKPQFIEAVMALTSLYQQMGKERAGTTLLESYQDKFGPNKEVAQALSRIYLQDEKFDKAYEQLDIIDGFESENLNVKIQMALILIEGEKFQEAAARLEEILSISPDLDKIRYYLGAVYEETNEWTRAIENYSKVPPGSVYYSEAVIHSAYLYKKYGQQARATEFVSQAIEVRDDIPQFYSFLASLLDDQKQYERGVQMLSKAVKKFPKDAQLNFFLGSMQDRLGNSDQTISQMRKVLEIEEDHVQALNYLAYTYAELNENLDEAEELAGKALMLKPDDPYVLDTLGWVQFKKGNHNEAIKFLELAYKKQSDEAVIAEHLGDVYYRIQLIDKAIKMYNKAISLESDNKKAKKILDKIASIEERMGDTLRTPASK